MLRRLACWLVMFLVSACVMPVAPPPAADDDTASRSADLPDLGAAPELTNEVWINVESPLRLADLRGKVVLLDMWTFG